MADITKMLGVLTMEWFFTAPGMLHQTGFTSLRDGRVFAQELGEFTGRALN